MARDGLFIIVLNVATLLSLAAAFGIFLWHVWGVISHWDAPPPLDPPDALGNRRGFEVLQKPDTTDGQSQGQDRDR